ncbi:MAG: hypothetical protein ACK5XB_11460, partial [Rhodospirillales bacterium]
QKIHLLHPQKAPRPPGIPGGANSFHYVPWKSDITAPTELSSPSGQKKRPKNAPPEEPGLLQRNK